MSIRFRWSRVKQVVVEAVTDTLNRRGLLGPGVHYRFLVACSRGLLLYDRGRVTYLLRGEHFGMTATDAPGIHYISESFRRTARSGIHDERSHVYRCRVDGGSLRIEGELRFHRDGRLERPVCVHQVRWHEGFLWVTNSRQNVVWKVRPDGEIVGEWTGSQRFDYDLENTDELLARVSASTHYHHYNSIAFRAGRVYVLAHNSARADKSRRSFLVTLDDELREVERRTDVGKACHDLLFCGDDLYICNSGEGTLLRNFEPVLRTGHWLRGLARIGSILIVGGSMPKADPAERAKSRSQLFFVDLATHRIVHTLALGRAGDVKEVLTLED